MTAIHVTVPVWLATWGTQSALVAAPNAQQARAIAVQRHHQAHPTRPPGWMRVSVRLAEQRDIDAFAESGALPDWCLHLADPPGPDPDVQQEALAL